MIESLIIESTEDSPEINFDVKTNTFIISGKSRPENTGKFYAPLFVWFDNFSKKLEAEQPSVSDKFLFIFKLEYFNSVSAKYILDILFLIKGISDSNKSVVIEWHYLKLDDDMLEVGHEFSDMTELDFKFIAD